METLEIEITNHAKKQCQMHTVARNITQRFEKSVPEEFGDTFSFGKVYYALMGDTEPITVEEYIEGKFAKYVNNNGYCFKIPNESHLKPIYEKAQTLIHWSYELTKGKMMITDVQGAGYQLYDPEIATDKTHDDQELLFCAGNLSFAAMGSFKQNHTCNSWCKLLKLCEFPPLETPEHSFSAAS